MPLCLAVEDLWRAKIRARLGEDAQYWYVFMKLSDRAWSHQGPKDVISDILCQKVSKDK